MKLREAETTEKSPAIRPRERLAERAKIGALEESEIPFRKRFETRKEEVTPRTPPVIRDMSAKPATVKESPLNITSSVPKEGYQLPPLSMLTEPIPATPRTAQEMQRNIETIEGTLEQFGIDANVVEVATGPTITRYEIQLGPGIRVARIVSLADNIAMDMAASQVRVEAPIPGKAAIGLEIPNASSSTVNLRELVESNEFMQHVSRLCVALGKDVGGVNRYADLTKMPHLLIAGATNSGKSIGLATLITSLLVRNTPKDVRLVLIDPKRVELTLFDNIPHLLCPVIRDVKEAPGALRAVIREMDRRYDLLSNQSVRNIDGWNEKATFAEKLPYIVVVIDELADLMIQSKAEVETSIVRIAQLARAVGIHLVIATQRPSVDVITGTIKANIPSRVAFAVASQIDSRTILDAKGADALIGKGDMLYMPIDASKPMRIQGCYVSEKEIGAICKFWKDQESPTYAFDPSEFEAVDGAKEKGDFGAADDPLWEDVVTFCAERGQASTSMIQRRFSVGFQRASRLLDMMEERGIVGPRDGPRPRDVLVGVAELERVLRGEPATTYDMGTHIEEYIDDTEA
jgi:S-DNA-T family DNA segregation ATPase FtsK/SpoIIIE